MNDVKIRLDGYDCFVLGLFGLLIIGDTLDSGWRAGVADIGMGIALFGMIQLSWMVVIAAAKWGSRR